jgi:hypothetical protein
MRDAPDENMVSSGGWDERDKYKISSGSRFFFFKISRYISNLNI